MNEKKKLDTETKIKLFSLFTVVGIIAIIAFIILGNTIYKNIKRDEKGFQKQYTDIAAHYKLTNWSYEDGIFKVFVNGDVWASMDNNQKLSYCDNICKSTVNTLHRYYIVDDLMIPIIRFYDMSGRVATFENDLILILK